ncbi:phosphate ABC transporter permease subunit PstC [Halobacteriovorax sp. GB3]|uniref:phosphate ABC transporter permease subunit PstC n=1 Tax=Halobacteriovorax sp. GB3 TaxID=2719615 RepID=UPI002360AEC3|nr:phosphate ABC transporter permease subunit PstC [Halobacteriovorax sp. GB3]MDD0851967.1 phosphate ABC transporter permease subunit PstC [Halobacteriovorax sp. GB3]
MKENLPIDKAQKNFDSSGSSPLLSYKSQDKLALYLLKGIGLFIIFILALMIYLLFDMSSLALKEYGLTSFIKTDWWNPVEDEFGALSFIYGTLVTSAIAIVVAAPLSIAMALFLTVVLRGALAKFLGLLVELIAAIPSIVFGLWGLFYLAPWVKNSLTPFLKTTLGFLPLFQGPSFGIGLLTAGIILAIMITPTITSLTREVFKAISPLQKEAALGLGATKFEMIKIAILKPSLSGILGACVLGLGRALGETMAVAMVIGNSPVISKSLFAPGATMASIIANEYAEAEGELHLSALCLIAIVLFLVTFIVNFVARMVIWRNNRRVKK